MTKNRWTSADIQDQTGRVAIVTGANSGIGLEAAKALAQRGATVVVASRSESRGDQAVATIRAAAPAAAVERMSLDLADLGSVREFAAASLERHDRLDLLINNAGVMMPREREETADGFELQFGTNHLGHFALTLRLLERIVATEGSRIVTVSSSAQNFGKLDLDDLQWKQRPFNRMASYGASKIANMLFTLCLQGRLAGAGSSTLTAACHPGWTRTNLQKNSPIMRMFNPLFAMQPWQGALPTLYAAVSADIVSGGYYGPDGWGSLRGYPAPNKPAEASTDASAAQRLWELSEQLTGVTTPRLATTATAATGR